MYFSLLKGFILCREGQQSTETHKFSAECDTVSVCFFVIYPHSQGYRVTIVQLYFSSLGEEANSILLNHVCTAYSLYI